MGIGAGVAIVGMGCRLPGGVYTPNQYWDFMLRRGDGIVEVPAERWNVDLFYDADPTRRAAPTPGTAGSSRRRRGISTPSSSASHLVRPK